MWQISHTFVQKSNSAFLWMRITTSYSMICGWIAPSHSVNPRNTLAVSNDLCTLA